MIQLIPASSLYLLPLPLPPWVPLWALSYIRCSWKQSLKQGFICSTLFWRSSQGAWWRKKRKDRKGSKILKKKSALTSGLSLWAVGLSPTGDPQRTTWNILCIVYWGGRKLGYSPFPHSLRITTGMSLVCLAIPILQSAMFPWQWDEGPWPECIAEPSLTLVPKAWLVLH